MILQLGQHPQALGVALEAEEVGTLGFAHGVEPAPSGGLLEPVADGVFTRVAERRVADVVGQAGGLDDDAQVRGLAPVGQRLA
ncbi:hypothetical protein D9M71_778310 [compost metagenome]